MGKKGDLLRAMKKQRATYTFTAEEGRTEGICSQGDLRGL